MRLKMILFILMVLVLAACGDDTPVQEQETVQETVAFRSMDFQMEDTAFTLIGEVNTEEDVFYYEIKQGDEVITAETSVDVPKEETRWVSFEISEVIPEDAKEAEDTPIITLYGKNTAGEAVNPNYIPIDIGIR